MERQRTRGDGAIDWVALARAYWAQDRVGRALGVVRAGLDLGPEDNELSSLRTDILRSRGCRGAWEDAGHAADPPTDRSFRPAPYELLAGFLDAGEMHTLRRLLAGHRDAFSVATVGTGIVDEEQRRSLRLRDPAVERIARRRFLRRLDPLIPGLVESLAGGAGRPGRVECKVTASMAGGFFKAHRDDVHHEGPETSNDDRVISYVCWIHREPARFTGGELMLHDSAADSYDLVSGTRFTPTAGGLVVFPSSTYHSVLPVAGEDLDLLDSRLAITGHVRARPSGP